MATLVSTKSSTGQPSSRNRVFEFTVSMDNSYPTGGETIAAVTAALNGYTILASPQVANHNGAAKRHFRIDPTTKKVMAYADDTLAEVAAQTDLSAHVNIPLVVIAE